MPAQRCDGRERRRIHVDGVVQGVGFRPFIYSLAVRYGLTGWVLNSSSGVDIEVQGAPADLDAFQDAITREAPRLARIDVLTAESIPPVDDRAFSIRRSESDAGMSLVSPDVATCPDCLAEIFDPSNRRYRYPFTNCTNCGPRYTIIRDMPYDRPKTTMSAFVMCARCRAEYEDPLNRRFHAQPNACPTCGPQVRLIVGQNPQGDNADSPGEDAIARTASLLKKGYIVAIKGLGGFHLACDATNADAVARLRERKSRPDKPFAVMLASVEKARRHCAVNEAEAAALSSPSAPIVLLYRREDSTIAANVAPRNPMLGVMLPYTPLHHILMHDVSRPLVMTSGNLSDMPIISDDDEALRALGHIADAFLLHTRPIHMRCDDAIWWVDRFADARDAANQPLRRSRGDAPYPIRLPWRTPQHILATGAEMKNTLCLLREDNAFVSQHLGEMDSPQALDYFRQALAHLSKIFKVQPQVIAHDLHPGYLTTRLARELADQVNAQLVGIQHHHAHVASCLAEHGRVGPVIGVVFDGTGYGVDGAIWGGEVLVASVSDFRRFAHLEYLPLPGGEAAIRRPYRIAWGYLYATSGSIPTIGALAHLSAQERNIVIRQVERRINTPLTSSCGRLFDAVAALAGVCQVTTFEAQAAIALEMAARNSAPGEPASYPFQIDSGGIIRLGDTLAAVVADVQRGISSGNIARKFHVTVAHIVVQAALHARETSGLNVVALSGGAFQNRLLLQLVREGLREAGFEALFHRQVPANDGGLSLGQAVIALHSLMQGS